MLDYRKMLITFSLIALLTLVMFPTDMAKAQSQPLFKVTIIAPGAANLLRRQWGQMFANSLQQLGINANVVFLSWSEVFDRVLTPPPDIVGKSYDEGGYDILLVGWTLGLFPEPRQAYYGGDPRFFAPEGQNYYLWNNTRSNDLLDMFITSLDAAGQSQSLQQWQSLYFDEVPASQIFYSTNPALVTPELSGYDSIYFGVQCNPEYLMGKTSVVYASLGDIESLIPTLSNSWYDTIVISPIFNGLAQVSNANQVTPALLISWAPDNNGFHWTFNLRNGVKWHDGHDFTTDDVVFSLWALMNADTGSQYVGTYRSVFGDRVKFTWQDGTSTTLGTGARVGNITAVDSSTVEAWLPAFTVEKPFGYIDPYLLTLANNIIPKHIFEKLPVSQWADSPFNTGQGSITIDGTTYTGPIGTGPYKWVDYNPAAQLVHLQKYDQYWNKTALEAEGRFAVTDYYVKFIYDKTEALNALENNEVDMLDVNYQMQNEVAAGEVDPSWATVFNVEGLARQEAGYNMRHPIFGLGVDTPLGTSDPSRAAEAARYVRTAFDHAIQRQVIIDNLLNGFGEPAATPIAPTQTYHDQSITARPYDLPQAEEYLERAGFPVGIPRSVEELRTKIEELVLEDQIDQGPSNSLIAKLDLAQRMIDRGEVDRAKAVLANFIRRVQKMSGIHMTAEAADLLTRSAEYIMSTL
ncbi:MAG TPA: ABC transporter substrate-binding protein [Candidatus Bathyarchaeia archaeon]|nr:ABC transporter substrate-binding protein [Candidatus Bathyarchaeia archaeon]